MREEPDGTLLFNLLPNEVSGETTLLTSDRLKVVGLVAGAFRYCERVNAAHAATFYRQRPAGSQWGQIIPSSPDVWAVMGWHELDPYCLPRGTTLPGCRYFRSTNPLLLAGAVEHIGRSGASGIHSDKIFFVSATDSHGPSLGTHEPIPQKPARAAHLVLGPAAKDDPNLIPWTAFPGEVSVPIPPEATSLDGIDFYCEDYAVKYYPKETAEPCS